MAEQTVREQLAASLEDAATALHADRKHDGRFKDCECWGCSAAYRALDRARAECAVETCTPACDQPTEAHCVECPCYQAGLEAQREPVGGGTA